MKHLRISFLAVVAIIAVGVTAVVKADVLKKKALVQQCTQANGDLASAVIGTVEFYNPSELSPATPLPPATELRTQCPAQDDVITGRALVSATINCDDSEQNIFCCAKFVSTGVYTIVCKKI